MNQNDILCSDSKVHGANMGPIWDRQGPGGPHVCPMNFVFWEAILWDIVLADINEMILQVLLYTISKYI